jgi:hypothetical protein
MLFIIASSFLFAFNANSQFNGMLLAKMLNTEPTDASYNSVSLLLHGDGVNNSTTITDNSSNPKTATVKGNTIVSTDTVKFGTGALEFDGNGDYLEYGNSTGFQFGTSALTIEGWMYFRTITSGLLSGILTTGGGTEGGIACYISASSGSSGTFRLYGPSVSGTITTSVSANTWYHLAIVRSNNTWYMFINGNSAGTMTDTASCNTSASMLFYVGGYPGGAFLNGFIDDLRVTKGVARYTANFTPPTNAFPNQG